MEDERGFRSWPPPLDEEARAEARQALQRRVAELQKSFRTLSREALSSLCGKGYEVMDMDEPETKSARLSARRPPHASRITLTRPD